MATRNLGRWRTTGAAPIGALSGAFTRSPVADCAPPSPRTRDQESPESGKLLCRVAQNGSTGEYEATDCDGQPLEVRSTGNGIEVWGRPDARDSVGEPTALEMERVPKPQGDASVGAPGELIPGYPIAEQRMAAAIAPTEKTGDNTPAGLRNFSKLLSEHYRRR